MILRAARMRRLEQQPIEHQQQLGAFYHRASSEDITQQECQMGKPGVGIQQDTLLEQTTPEL